MNGQPMRSSLRSLAERVVGRVGQLRFIGGTEKSSRYDGVMNSDTVSGLLEEQVTPVIHATIGGIFNSSQSFSDVYEMTGMLPHELVGQLDHEMDVESAAEMLSEL